MIGEAGRVRGGDEHATAVALLGRVFGDTSHRIQLCGGIRRIGIDEGPRGRGFLRIIT